MSRHQKTKSEGRFRRKETLMGVGGFGRKGRMLEFLDPTCRIAMVGASGYVCVGEATIDTAA